MRRRLAQRALLRRRRRHRGRGAGGLERLVPALTKRWRWRSTTAGHQRLGLRRPARAAARRVRAAPGRACAPSRSRAARRPSTASRAAASVASSRRAAGAPLLHQLQRLVDRQRRRVGQPGAHRVLQPRQAVAAVAGCGCGQALSSPCWVLTRSSILPRLNDCESSSRSAGSSARISSGSRSARSRKRLLTERSSTLAACCAGRLRGGLARLRRRAGGRPRGARITGHAVDCHRLGCLCLVQAKPRLCQSPNPRRCPPARSSAATGSSRNSRRADSAWSIVAEDREGHLVALKEYLPSSLAERAPGELTPRVMPEKQPLYRLGLKSFFEEGRSLAQISHPSVVSVLNFFRENETVYMVMNYLQGDTLQDFIVTARDLKRDKVFRESTIRSLFDEILRGLRIVHQHKMLHLDIKPANIFITNDNRAVLLDFGAAREVLSKEGNFIRPMYTPGFAAPEMYRRDGTLGPGPTSTPSARASTPACRATRPTTRRSGSRRTVSRSACRGCATSIPTTSSRSPSGACRSTRCRARRACSRCRRSFRRETERRYTKLSFGERLKLQLENLTAQPSHEPAATASVPAMRFSVHQVSRKGGREKNEDRVGLLLHARLRPLRARRRHGRPPARRGRVAAGRRRRIVDLFQREAGRRWPTRRVPPRRDRRRPPPAARYALRTRSTTRRAPPSSPAWCRATRPTGRTAAIRASTSCAAASSSRRTRDHSYRELQETLGQVGRGRRARQPQRALHLPGRARPSRWSTPPGRCCSSPATACCCAPTACGAAVDDATIADAARRRARSPTPCPHWSTARCARAARTATT